MSNNNNSAIRGTRRIESAVLAAYALSSGPPGRPGEQYGIDWANEFAPKAAPTEGDKIRTGLPLFELEPSVCAHIPPEEECLKMLRDMQACGILRLPYERIAVRFWLADVIGIMYRDRPANENLKSGALKNFITFVVDGNISVAPHAAMGSAGGMVGRIVQTDGKIVAELPSWWTEDATQVAVSVAISLALAVLLIALATRNVVKATEHNTRTNNKHKQSKPQFRGPQGAIYVSVTRVEAPRTEDMEQERGGTARPHLRRGHAHTVLFGIGRRERRVQWFPAVFVNRDPNHVPPARRYVVQDGCRP